MGLRFQLCESLASKENGVICFLSLSKMLIQDKNLLKDLSVMACPKILGQSTDTYMYYIHRDLWQLVTLVFVMKVMLWHFVSDMVELWPYSSCFDMGIFSFAGTDRMVSFKNVVNLLRSLKDICLCYLAFCCCLIDSYWHTTGFYEHGNQFFLECLLHARAGGLMPMTDQLGSQ
jgi:hypothetical protein